MKDILLDANFDLSIKDGDFEIGESTAQNIEQILWASPGEFPDPKIGVQIIRYINASQAEKDRLERELNVQLRDLEGMKINSIDTSQGIEKLFIDAQY